jgi:hypothetical protein
MNLLYFKDLHRAGGRIRHVFPLHQRALLDLLAMLPETVDEVWVFGSTLTLRCGQDSDLDVCLVGDVRLEDTKDLWVLQGVPLGLVLVGKSEFYNHPHAPDSIYHSIQTNGLKIWDREEGLQ